MGKKILPQHEFTRSYEPIPPDPGNLPAMDSFSPLILNALRRHRNQRRLTLEMLSAKVSMSPQHISEIESGKRDPRLSSIERMAEAMGLTVLLLPETMAPEVRRYSES